jgi:3-oxo-4,17-pregnadiene-20-carboxyl-CoA hydratase alpha subunit
VMNDDKKKAFEAEIYSYVGEPIGPWVIGRDPINLAMIRQWCDAMGDRHPAYLDEDAARETVHGEIVAPPTMLQAWIMDGFEMAKGYDEPQNEQQRLHKFLVEAGYSGVLGTNTEENYTRYLRLGETVKSLTVIDSISEEKATGVGIGYFITTKTVFENEEGEDLGSMSFRVLRYRPADQQQENAAAAEGGDAEIAAKPSRIKPPMGKDNGWWWTQVKEEDCLPIQRCFECSKLRHPPRPMCDGCGSQKWDSIKASGRGVVHTFTVIHHPQFPGYDYPIVSIIVDLEEGERMASSLVECKPEDCRIGMPVEVVIHEDEDGFKIPLFRPASG